MLICEEFDHCSFYVLSYIRIKLGEFISGEHHIQYIYGKKIRSGLRRELRAIGKEVENAIRN